MKQATVYILACLLGLSIGAAVVATFPGRPEIAPSFRKLDPQERLQQALLILSESLDHDSPISKVTLKDTATGDTMHVTIIFTRKGEKP